MHFRTVPRTWRLFAGMVGVKHTGNIWEPVNADRSALEARKDMWELGLTGTLRFPTPLCLVH